MHHKYWRTCKEGQREGREDKGNTAGKTGERMMNGRRKKGMKGNIRDVYHMSDQESTFKYDDAKVKSLLIVYELHSRTEFE